jgi:hypothetical protein
MQYNTQIQNVSNHQEWYEGTVYTVEEIYVRLHEIWQFLVTLAHCYPKKSWFQSEPIQAMHGKLHA